MTTLTFAEMEAICAADLRNYGMASPRSRQSAAGRLGPSDIGFCRNKAALTTKGIEHSDEKSIFAAQMGTAIHTYEAHVMKFAHPEWIIPELDWEPGRKITATLPSGVEISGTPDAIATDWNAVIDVKSKDGLEWQRREGSSQSDRFQRHLYALAAIQEGLVKEEGLLVGNLYIDRSGKNDQPLLLMESYDPTLTAEIDAWIDDVVYAVMNKEDASRDLPAAVCEKICEFFTVCRGGLEVHEGGDLIEDPTLISAIDMYVEARDLEKVAAQQKKEAAAILAGINGTDGRFQVRWVHVNATTVNSFDKAAFDRLDIRAQRGKK
jgi:hypothetical protein